jgi:hypothetical protein
MPPPGRFRQISTRNGKIRHARWVSYSVSSPGKLGDIFVDRSAEDLVWVRLGPPCTVAIEQRTMRFLFIAVSIKKLHHVQPSIGDASREMCDATLEWVRKGWRVQHGLSS